MAKKIQIKKSEIKLPANVYIGKEQSNGLMIGGRPVYSSVAQIFLQCNGKEKGCHDTIALLPNRNANKDPNDIIDSISTNRAAKIFAQSGWLVYGYNNNAFTRCPICAKKVKAKLKMINK